MHFHVPSAHLALVTAPVTCVWFCSIPAPIATLWESSVMTEYCWTLAAAVPRTPGNMGGSLLGSRLGLASCWPVCYPPHLWLQADFYRRMSQDSGSVLHFSHPQDMSAPTLMHVLFLFFSKSYQHLNYKEKTDKENWGNECHIISIRRCKTHQTLW